MLEVFAIVSFVLFVAQSRQLFFYEQEENRFKPLTVRGFVFEQGIVFVLFFFVVLGVKTTIHEIVSRLP